MTSLHSNALVHLVIWRLNGATPDERAQQAKIIVDAFRALSSQISGLLRMEVGSNIVEATDAWDVALYMVFASRADLDAYQTHPGHLQIKALVGPLRSERGQADFWVTC